jgi:hypothetical protein
VSEESSTGAPGTAAPEAEARAPGRRWVSWLSRTSLRVRIAAGVAAAAVIAAIVFVAMPSSSPPPKPAYASLPVPCSLVSPATLARYLPNPMGTPLSTYGASTIGAGGIEVRFTIVVSVPSSPSHAAMLAADVAAARDVLANLPRS